MVHELDRRERETEAKEKADNQSAAERRSL